MAMHSQDNEREPRGSLREDIAFDIAGDSIVVKGVIEDSI